MTLDLERIRAAVLSANPTELRRWVEALRRLCIPCQWTPPRHCGHCPCCRQPEPPVKQYHFYRIWRDKKFYLFCRAVGTPNRSNAALFTEADWLEWGEVEGLQREEVE